MIKSCGNCAHWQKLATIKGLCEKNDLGWANSDHTCKEHSKKKRDHRKDRREASLSILSDEG